MSLHFVQKQMQAVAIRIQKLPVESVLRLCCLHQDGREQNDYYVKSTQLILLALFLKDLEKTASRNTYVYTDQRAPVMELHQNV